MSELINIDEVSEQQALVLILNQLQLISVQLYRIYDLLAVDSLQTAPETPRSTQHFNPEVKSILDYHESGAMPEAAKMDFLGEDDESTQQEGQSSG